MFSEQYNSKLVSVKEAAQVIKSGDKILSNPISGMPMELIRQIGARAGELDHVELHSLFILEPFNFLVDPEAASHIKYTSHFMGPVERKLYPNKLFHVDSCNFSDLSYRMIEQVKPNVFVLQGTPMDEDGYFNLGPMGSPYSRQALDKDMTVILQVNKKVTKINKHETPSKESIHLAHIDEVDYICEFDEAMVGIPSSVPTELENKIADQIIPHIPDGATLQVGFGGLSNAVSLGMIGKVTGLAVHTEMITESMIELRKQGVITETITGAFALGTQALYEFTEEDDNVVFRPLAEVNKPSNISAIDKFVSINACLMVDLTGQVASEGIGHRQVSSVGGASDFVRGASHSKGGKSFVCVSSSNVNKEGKRTSNIIFALPPATPVTCPRQDIMNVVTEYGIADIHNQPISERAKRLIAVAHPDFREELTKQAEEAGYLR